MSAPSDQSAGDPIALTRLHTGLDPLVCLADRGDLGPVRKGVWKRLDTSLAEAVQLRSPLGE
jgi:hypothetical protein